MRPMLLSLSLSCLVLLSHVPTAEPCARVEADFGLELRCVAFGTDFLWARLKAAGDEREPSWTLDQYRSAVGDAQCAMLDDQLDLRVPCVDLGAARYRATLQRFPTGDYRWRLASAEAVTPSSCNGLVIHQRLAARLQDGAIFPGIVDDGEKLLVSFAKANDLWVQAFDEDFQALSGPRRITFRGDVTDHKHLFYRDAHYLLYSTIGDSGLYLLKLNRALEQQGAERSLGAPGNSTRTNDMLLARVDDTLVTGQFRPADLNRGQASGHLIKRFDEDLQPVDNDTVLNQMAHTNTAALLQVADRMLLLAPSTPNQGAAVRTQRDLLLLDYDRGLSELRQASSLLSGSDLDHQTDGDGIWMATGFSHDAGRDCLLAGHTFTQGGLGDDSGVLYLRVFDRATLTQTAQVRVGDSTHANRLHLLLRGDDLYGVYDDGAAGTPAIYGFRYRLGR